MEGGIRAKENLKRNYQKHQKAKLESWLIVGTKEISKRMRAEKINKSKDFNRLSLSKQRSYIHLLAHFFLVPLSFKKLNK